MCIKIKWHVLQGLSPLINSHKHKKFSFPTNGFIYYLALRSNIFFCCDLFFRNYSVQKLICKHLIDFRCLYFTSLRSCLVMYFMFRIWSLRCVLYLVSYILTGEEETQFSVPHYLNVQIFHCLFIDYAFCLEWCMRYLQWSARGKFIQHSLLISWMDLLKVYIYIGL